MKTGSISSAIFALSCVTAAFLSSSILGPGLWAWMMLGTGLAVAASPYFYNWQAVGGVIALIAAALALIATLLGLLAATIGGSFNLPADQALLLVLFLLIGISGIVLFRALQRK